MKTILVGYPGSQIIRKGVEYLNNKYLPPDFEITYLVYEGKIEDWSAYLADYFATLTDEMVIFSLDDYLINAPVDKTKLDEAIALMKEKDIVCIKLCSNSEDEFIEYPITTQYCLWNREYLISLLKQTTTPWDFEINGSRIFKTIKDKKVLLETCLSYYTNSSISARWQGVDLQGLNDEDKKEFKKLCDI